MMTENMDDNGMVESPGQSNSNTGMDPVDDTSDRGMNTATGPAELVEPSGEAGDRGLQAVEPILADGALPEKPVLPPQSAMQGAPYFSPAALQPPGLDIELPESSKRDQVVEQPGHPETVNFLVTNKRQEEFWERIDRAFNSVNEYIPSLPIARQMLDHLKYARNELLAGADRYEEAERHLREVEYRVARYQLVKASNTTSYLLLGYELAWFGLLVWGLMALAPWVQGALAGVTLSVASIEDVAVLVNSILWGGVGGLVGALYALWRHTAVLQDFDKQYSMWYLTNPIMGLILGAFSFLVIRAGLFSLTSGGGSITSPYFIYVMAWIVGFQQNVAYDIVRRVLGIFKTADDKPRSQTSTE